MATISIQVTRSDYQSMQVGDKVFYTNTSAEGSFQSATQSSVVEVGNITNINNATSLDDGTLTTTITCDIDDSTVVPTTSSYLFFAKDNEINLTSLVGYYGLAKFKNNSLSEAELYATACEVNESSK